MLRITMAIALGLSYSSITHALGGGGFSLEESWFNQADISNNEQVTREEAKRLKNFNLSDPEVYSECILD